MQDFEGGWMLHIFGVLPIVKEKMKPDRAHPKIFAGHKTGLADHWCLAGR
jgi:hypothetical protein